MGELKEKNRKLSAVLFVDDEVNILNSIRRAIIDEEYVAYFANNATEALDIMEKNEISVIVTDMKMPGMDGLQLLKIVKEKYPNIVKIVLSGYTQISQVLATINQADIFNFITKPWNMENELKYVIDKAIEHYWLKKTEVQLTMNLEKRNIAYQNVLKKMEISSTLRAKQIQNIKKINNLLLKSIEMKKDNDIYYLAKFLSEYIDKLSGEADPLPLLTIIEKLRLLFAADPRYSQENFQVNEAMDAGFRGNYTMIQFAVSCMLKLVPKKDEIGSFYIHMAMKEDKQDILTFSLFFLDAAGRYEQQTAQCSYQLAEEIFREIMDVRFSTWRKNDRQVIQLEFSLEQESV